MEWAEWLKILAGPVFMVIGGIITWLIKSRTEELRTTKAKLEAEQRKIYSEILEPYIRLFAGLKEEGTKEAGINKARQKIVSYDYRKTAFDLNLIGSDEVVEAYNELMQHSFKAEETGEKNPNEMMRLWGALLLEIRKSLGHKNTKLTEKDMLRAMITDIDKLL